MCLLLLTRTCRITININLISSFLFHPDIFDTWDENQNEHISFIVKLFSEILTENAMVWTQMTRDFFQFVQLCVYCYGISTND